MEWLSALALLVLTPGCAVTSLIFGGNQEADTHSHSFSALRLDQEKDGSWTVLKPEKGETPDALTESDISYEHSPTWAVISLTSDCREATDLSLEELSRNLFVGLPINGESHKKRLTVDGVPALQNTFDTRNADNDPVRIRAIVLKKQGCTYDLMYVVEPENFDALVSYFNKFVKGFHSG